MFNILVVLAAIFAVVTATSASQTTRLLVRKCCPSWKHLQPSDENVSMCIPREGAIVRHVSEETLADAISAESSSKVPWLPRSLEHAASKPMDWTVEYGKQPSCENSQRLEFSTSETERYRLEPNGSLVLFSPMANGSRLATRFDPRQYCIDSVEHLEAPTDSHLIQVCPCEENLCVRKCCPRGMVMRVGRGLQCQPSSSLESWKPFDWVWGNESSMPMPIVSYEILESAPPHCILDTVVKNPKIEPNHILDSWFAYPYGRIFQNDEVCGDLSLPEVAAGSESSSDTEPLTPSVAFCTRLLPFPVYSEMAGAAHSLAAALLLASLLAQLALPERRRSALGLALASHSLALLGAALLLALRQVSRSAIGDCAVTPFVIYFCLVNSEFWLNVIAFSIARSFRDAEGGGQRAACGRWAWGALWGWGAAGLLTAAAATAWHFPRPLPPWLPRPSLHETRSCHHQHVTGTFGIFFYYLGPMAALTAVNFILIIYTALRVRQLDKHATLYEKDSTHTSRPPQRAVLYVKLMLILEVLALSAEVGAWAFSGQNTEQVYVVTMDCLDLIRACVVFVLCVWQRRVRDVLRSKMAACVAPLRRLCCCGRYGECCGRKVLPASEEWRYVVGGAPAPIAGSEERRQRQRRRTLLTDLTDDRPVIELWSFGGPNYSSFDDTPSTRASQHCLKSSEILD